MRFPFSWSRFTLPVLLLMVLASPARGAVAELEILLDLDDDPGTGCTVATVDGAFDGVEQILVTTAEQTGSGGTVQRVERRECTDPTTDTFGPPILVDDTGWPVGVGLGVDGASVVETYFPLAASSVPDPDVVRLGVIGRDGSRGEDALLVVQPGGSTPILLDLLSVLEIPTLSGWGFMALALVLVLAALARLRRQTLGALVALVLVLGGVGLAWAAGVLDGQIGDWSAADLLARDPEADGPPAADLVALFGRGEGGRLCLRIDAFLDDPPTLSAVADQTIPEDGTTGPLAFTVGDTETPAGSLTVSATSSNQTLVPDGNLVLGGAGANRTVTVTPLADRNGVATVTLTVTDGGGQSASTSFDVTVTSQNDPPTITAIADQVIDEDTTTGPLAFTVGDTETPAGSLTVSATSSDQGLLPDANLLIAGTAPNLTVEAVPAADQSGGPVTVTLTVQDTDGGSAAEQLTVTVNPINDPPTITPIVDQVIDEDTSTGALAFQVGDVDDPVGSLVVSASSSLPALIPNAGLTLAGAAPNLTIEATPLPDENGGPATVTLSVTDGKAPVVTTSFAVTVTAVNDPPVAVDESYTTVGNTELAAGGAPPTSLARVTATAGVLDNGDADPVEGTMVSLVGLNGTPGAFPLSGSSALGGDVTLFADGSFVYVPPVGIANRLGGSADSFTYLIEDADGAQATGTVTLEIVDALVWYVHNDPAGEALNGAGGDGRSSDPFDKLSDADADTTPDDPEDASGPGHFIFVFEGDGTTAGHDLGIDLQAGQTLLGHATATHAFGGVVVQTPNPPPGTATPATDQPRIEHTAGDGIGVSDVTGVTILDLDVAGSDNAIQIESTGSADVGVTLTNVTVSQAGNEGIRLRHGSTGTMTATLESGSVTATGHGIDAATTAGSLDLTLKTHTVSSTGGSGVLLDGSGGGTLRVVDLADLNVAAAAAGGVVADTVTFDADPADPDFLGDTVPGGSLAIGAPGTPVTGPGLSLGTVSGDLAFGDFDVFSAGGAGLAVTGTGVLNAGGGTGFRIATPPGSTVSAQGAAAVDIDPASAALTFDVLTSTASPDFGISLVDVVGTFTAGALSSITGAAGSDVRVINGDVDVTYSGTIDDSAGRFLEVTGTPNGSFVTLDGASIVSNGGSGAIINDVQGNVTIGAGSTTITNSTNSGVAILGDTDGTVTLNDITVTDPALGGLTTTGPADEINGTIDCNNYDISYGTGVGPAVSIRQLNTGAVVDFDAASSIVATSGTGVGITSNPAGTVTFNGPVDLGTGPGNRLTAGLGFTVLTSGTGLTVNVADLDVFTNGAQALTGNSAGTLNATVGTLDTMGSAATAVDLDGMTTAVTVASTTCSTDTDCVHLNALGAGSTVDFVGLDLTSTGGTAFNASGAGTVQVTGGANTISATNAVGLSMIGTAIGSAGVSFQSISASGAASGIVLSGTGGNKFEVTGEGASDPTVSVGTRGRTLALAGGGTMSALGTGGTITGTTGDGVSLTNAPGVILRNLTIGDAAATPGQAPDGTASVGDDGIEVTGGSGLLLDNVLIARSGRHGLRAANHSDLTIVNSEILNAGTAIDEHGVRLTELLGTSTITSTIVDGMHSRGIFVTNDTKTSAATPDELTVDNVRVANSDPIAGEIGVQFTSAGVGNFRLAVLDSVIEDVEGNGIGVFSGGTNAADPSNAHLEVRRTTITGTGSPDITVPTAIQVNPSFEGNSTFDIIGNNPGVGGGFTGIPTAAIILKNDSNGLLRGTVEDNFLRSAGEGVFVVADGAIGMTSVTGTVQVTLIDNDIDSSSAHGISMSAQDGAVALEAKLGDNVTAAGGPALSFQNGIFLDVQSGTACFNLAKPTAGTDCTTNIGSGRAGCNTATGAGSGEGIFLQKIGGSVVLEGFGGGNDTAASTFLNDNNTSTPAALVFSGDTVGTGTCSGTP